MARYHEFPERDFDERRRLLSTWLFILHNLEPSLRKQWLEKETQSHLLALLDLFAVFIETMEVLVVVAVLVLLTQKDTKKSLLAKKRLKNG